MADIKVVFLFPKDGGYQLQYGSELSEEFDFGEPGELVLKSGRRIIGYVDVARNNKDLETTLEHFAYFATPAPSVMDGEGEGEDEAGEGEQDDQDPENANQDDDQDDDQDPDPETDTK